MDLVEKYKLITAQHINNAQIELKCASEAKTLEPDHRDSHVVEDPVTNKETKLEETIERDVKTVIVKNEGSDEFMLLEKHMDVLNDDENHAGNVNDEFILSNQEYTIPNDSITLEAKLLDDAPCETLRWKPAASGSAVAEQVAGAQDPIKYESAIFFCTLCLEEYVYEHDYIEHMSMHLQDRDGESGKFQEYKHLTPVNFSDDSSNAPPVSARLALNNENKVHATEQADTIQKSSVLLEINNCELDNRSSDSENKRNINIDRFTNSEIKVNVFRDDSLVYEKHNSVSTCESKNIDTVPNELNYESASNSEITSKPLQSETDYTNNDINIQLTSSSSDNSLLIEKEWLTCDICRNMFRGKSTLAEHIKTHIEVKPFACQFCQYKCKYKGQLIVHVRTHTGEKPYWCKVCKFKCILSGDLVRHMRCHMGEKPYSCKLCQFKCIQSGDLVRHVRTHTGEKPYSCELCEYKCGRNNDLRMHMRTHTGEKPYSCKMCDRKYSRKSKLVIHLRTHTGEKPFLCELCNNKFSQKSYLVNHMKTHSGQKPFSCELCEYKCTQKCVLVNHMRTHTGEKPFSCELCHNKFSQKTHLVSHMKIHSGEKPFSCKSCKYTCARKGHLVIHMKTHTKTDTDEKPHSCNVCDYKCATKTTLVKHMLSHSGAQP